jgi:uncharacterized protein (TIGR02145 family)
MRELLLLPIFMLVLSLISFSQDTLFVPQSYTSIQQAIDVAADGSFILVAPGVYYENLSIIDKNVQIESCFSLSTDVNEIEQTKIIGSQNGIYNRVIEIFDSEATMISGFYISGGNSTTLHANGVYIYNSTVDVLNCIIAGNKQPNSASDGAGVHCHSCSLSLTNTLISNNEAGEFGGGLFVENASNIEVEGCEITGNMAGISGGGIFIDSSSTGNVTNTVIHNNDANFDGGGIYAENCLLEIEQSSILDNHSSLSNPGHGGGLAVFHGAQISLSHCVLSLNSSVTGGGLYSYNSNVSAHYCEITRNITSHDGGGITFSATSAGIDDNFHELQNCTFYDNEAAQINSNGIKVAGDTYQNISIVNSIIWENVSDVYSTNIDISYSNMQQQDIDGEGVISELASFVSVDPDSPDYRLNCDSPCIDSGTPNEVFNDSDGSINDMGCYPVYQGCTHFEACNYDDDASCDDSSCDYCFCGEGTQWVDSLQACMVTEAALMQACGEGTYWDDLAQACLTIETCQEDLDGDGIVGINDLLELLSSFGSECVIEPETTEFTCGDPVSYHGYDYATVQIGEQCWFAENLRTSVYRNGDILSTGLSEIDWVQADFGAQTPYDDDFDFIATYGILYNWFAVNDSRSLCPNDWHVPSDADFISLELELGMDETQVYLLGLRGTNEGEKIKSSSTETPSWDGTNSSGFSGLPGGSRYVGQEFPGYSSGDFVNEGSGGNFWSSTAIGNAAWYRALNSSQQRITRSNAQSQRGMSVRCLKDTEE